MNRLFLCIFTILLVSQAFAQPVPFDPGRGLVEIEVTIDGIIKGTFGIDTGADRLYIDRAFAEDNHLSINEGSGRFRVAGINGSSETGSVDIRSLRLAERETLYNLTATSIDMHALAGEKGNPPDGLIGFDVLRRFYVHVDYPERTMELISSEPDFLRGGDYDEVDFEQNEHMVLVEVDFGGGVTAPMIFDYCASYTTISPELSDRLGLEPGEEGKVTIGEMTIGADVGSFDVQAVVVDHSNLRQSVPDAEFEGLIGASFFYRWEITVDYRRGRIYVH